MEAGSRYRAVLTRVRPALPRARRQPDAIEPTAGEPAASEPAASEPVPWGQRLLDSPFILLGAGMLVMFVFYTGWGMVEILGLPASRLP